MEGKILIEGVFNITGIGPVLVSQVIEGQINIGMTTTIQGNDYPIKKMEANHKSIQAAFPGQKVGIVLTSLKKNVAPLKGDQLAFSDEHNPGMHMQQSIKTQEKKGLFSFITKWFER
ncbi:hypothetical protein HOD20_08665 [archaeon]|jgi:selenocysteine-specific translation elongation factor|nr:hypothetical protein [archaeon]MBT4352581.1 hypothetical protein [archaeon]MBT4647794.1 hypothetical protein [archaeon]MBT6821655.1 hypothetical protein [archaeon]MBT7391817.1 hypothetical protein [archaeon]